MPNLHLTDMAVSKLKPAANRTYWDDTTPGFGIRVGKRTKTWTVMRGSYRDRVTLGHYPALSLSDARAEAKKLLSAELDLRPKQIRVPVEAAKLQFLEENYRNRAIKTKAGMTSLLKLHVKDFPEFLDEVGDAHIQKCLDRLKDRPSAQLHVFRAMRCFLRWCTRPPRRYLKHSPMEGYEQPSTPNKRSRILSDAELEAVWLAAGGSTNAIVRLLILWGTRNTETASIRREWLVDGVLTIPGSHTKNGRDHSIPVMPMAKQILDATPHGKHYFLSRWGESHLSSGAWSKIRRQIQKDSKTSEWQLRDLRRTFRSNMARLKVPREVCEVLINHAPPVLDEIYDRYDRLDEKREALARYESFLARLLQPEMS
ncbi:MAG: site-specific integrase [Alphaproteobacteria bacterium]|nr:site-specific integrase [Alphaproteobacteria bacterium]MBL7097379.1 site-specific integrase [Alphaproteobacteria bacterium]